MNEINKNRLIKMFEMRVNGASYNEIADAFSCSRQFVQQSLISALRQRQNIIFFNQIIYPNIKSWLIANEMSIDRFASLAGISGPGMRDILSGRKSPRISTATKIARATGFSLDQAFSTEREEL